MYSHLPEIPVPQIGQNISIQAFQWAEFFKPGLVRCARLIPVNIKPGLKNFGPLEGLFQYEASIRRMLMLLQSVSVVAYQAREPHRRAQPQSGGSFASRLPCGKQASGQ